MRFSASTFAFLFSSTLAITCPSAIAEPFHVSDGIKLAADVNNDGISDFALYGASVTLFKYDVISGADGVKLTSFSFPDPDSFAHAKFHWVADRDNDGVQDIGLFGLNTTTDKYQFVLKSSKTGGSLGTWTWNNTLFLPEFNEIDDITLDGMPEFGVLGTHVANSTLQLQVRDGKLKSPVATFKWPNIWDDPRVVTMSDVTGDSIPEVAIYGVNKRRGNGQLFVYDGALATNKLDVYNWGKHWGNTSLYQLEDIDGDGTNEWGQFGKRHDDGRYQMLMKRGSSKVGVLRTLTWNTTMNVDKPVLLDDITNDGIQEVALAQFDVDLRFKILINDGRLPNKRIKNISWPMKWLPFARLVQLHDIDGDGVGEVGLLGPDISTGNIVLSIKSLVTGKELTQYTWDKQWTNGFTQLEIFDANNDGVLDYALTGYQDLSFFERISVISGTSDRAVIFDKIVGQERATLSSFLTATYDTDFRYITSFNDALRANDNVEPLLFDGDLLHYGAEEVLPYTVNNSLLTLHHDDGDEEINFTYVSDEFGVSLSPDAELSLFTQSSFNLTSDDKFDESMISGKIFSYLMDDSGANSTFSEPLGFYITFYATGLAFVGAESIVVPWSIDSQGRLVIALSEHNGDDDLVFSRYVDDGNLFVIKDESRNDKPLLMSEDLTLMTTLHNNWLIAD
ncbi:hypothetical protein [Shewanella sp. 6_MG-2023]|uniref:hypothetical protein n=1 Tax=Shewanella sp. 6_MG-2023 TaxID=3062660 RepID=UPI0026E30A2D|nr:hypothetical protein [Shewanella sp. 6_MG-2023]MDO6617631.1 hypothetical protein [Shewanella sp. 6_MG-2023]